MGEFFIITGTEQECVMTLQRLSLTHFLCVPRAIQDSTKNYFVMVVFGVNKR